LIEIRVVGDSSSSGIGAGKVCYPHHLFRSLRLRAHHDFRLVNYSVPGLTSADAARLCYSAAFQGSYDYLVVYLGNNERACTAPKGVARFWRRRLLGARNRGRALRSPLLEGRPYDFRPDLPPARPIPPDVFGKNLSLMIGSARKAGASVVLIEPIANTRFPAGIHAINGLFFKHIGLVETTGRLLEGTDPQSDTLVEAIRLHEKGSLDEARGLYARLAESADPLVAFIARHNRVTCLDDRCRAIEGLSELLGTFPLYDSIVLYNLSRLCRKGGDQSEAERYLEAAAERDGSSYSVTRPYRAVIERLAMERGLPLIDLASILEPAHFIDYCHPTAAGHRRIAQELAAVLSRPMESRVEGRHSYEDRFVSPNAFSEDADLITYYQIDRDLSPEQIRAALKRTMSGDWARPGRDELASFLERFFAFNDAHAAFGLDLDVLGAHLPLSHEVLSFPEFYLYRLLRGYGIAFEEQGLATRIGVDHVCPRLLLCASRYEDLILRHNQSTLDIELNLGLGYLRSIESRLRRAPHDAAFTNRIEERIKTLGVWYTREAFRYGTQSRLSMLYDSWALERIAEAVGVAAVIAAHHGFSQRLQRYGRLICALHELNAVHLEHAARYRRDADRFQAAEYERDLGRVGAGVLSLLGDDVRRPSPGALH
jgi:tetratricopeptide (TPR) repeat protein